MADLVALINAAAALIWPLLLGYVLWLLLPPLRKIIASRAFSIKFSGLELSVQEATEQITDQLKDLQDQLIALQAKVAMGPDAAGHDTPQPPGAAPVPDAPQGPAPTAPAAPADPVASKRILWVDDQPRNNALEISQLESKGHTVMLAGSTAEAMRELQRNRVDMIISDMGRTEQGRYVADAGLQLLQQLRTQGHAEPFTIYSSAKLAAQNDAMVRSAGGDGATSSTLALMRWIQGLG